MKLHFQDHLDQDFSSTLRDRVNDYFASKGISRYANTFGYVKGVVLLLLCLCTYLNIYMLPGHIVLLFGLLGVWKITLAVNVANDAAHHAFFSSIRANWRLLMLF